MSWKTDEADAKGWALRRAREKKHVEAFEAMLEALQAYMKSDPGICDPDCTCIDCKVVRKVIAALKLANDCEKAVP